MKSKSKTKSAKSQIGLTILLILLLAGEVASFSGFGSGTENDPYIITTCTQLQEMENDLGSYYELSNDIDCAGFGNFNPVGNFSNRFAGTFDGKAHKIKNVQINTPFDNGAIFALIDSEAEVKNVGVENVNVIASNEAGALVGRNSGTITNSYATGNVSGSTNDGGLVGRNEGLIIQSYSSINVVASAGQGGGLVGHGASGTIIDSYATGNVSGGTNIGGLVGGYGSSITNSYATGNVSGTARVGGLVGLPGGVVITNGYWDRQTSERSNMCGDSGTGCDNSHGKTTAEMMQQSTFVGWDFTNIWAIDEEFSYPYFRSQLTIPATSCIGFEAPMDMGPVTVKKNRALPLKAQLFDAEGFPVTDAEIASPPVIQVLFDSGTGGDLVDVTDDAFPAGQGTEGNQYIFTQEQKWQYNLKTKSYAAPGTYTITMESGDETEYLINPTCTAIFVIE